MAGIPKEHKELYFDALCRTQKAETVLSLIHATYHTREVGTARKVKIAEKLLYSYNLLRDNLKGQPTGAGSYNGSVEQFDSQYTIGHELSIWVNSDLVLNKLAESVAKNHITIRDYFDIFFLNYFQPINGKAVHLLHSILVYMKSNNLDKISKNNFEDALKVKAENEAKNALFQFLIGTNFFDHNSDHLILRNDKYSLDYLMSLCNTEYIGESGLIKAKSDLSDEGKYVQYITSSRKLSEIKKTSAHSSATNSGFNKIYYGTPGCGKSYHINKKYELDSQISVRTVFHPDYSNTDFVGGVVPTVKGEIVTYEVLPGPFILAYEKAINNQDKMVYLIIEELNRGNASSIFGDIFQLLDRNKEGESIYSIHNQTVKNYFERKGQEFDSLRVPRNLTILATMNTSDQNVFTLDTAFKRRWKMELVPNKFNDQNALAKMYIPGTNVMWQEFVNKINQAIISRNFSGINGEDKKLGVYFVSEDELTVNENETAEEAAKLFAEKIIMYIWEDIAKLNPKDWFIDDCDSLDSAIELFSSVKLNIFNGIFSDET